MDSKNNKVGTFRYPGTGSRAVEHSSGIHGVRISAGFTDLPVNSNCYVSGVAGERQTNR